MQADLTDLQTVLVGQAACLPVRPSASCTKTRAHSLLGAWNPGAQGMQGTPAGYSSIAGHGPVTTRTYAGYRTERALCQGD